MYAQTSGPTVSFQLVGVKRHCPRDAGKKEFLLGWGDRTCSQLASIGPQLLTNSSTTTDFRSWDVEFVTRKVVRLITRSPSAGTMLCSGSLAVANPQSCHDSKLTITSSAAQSSDEFILVPVPARLRAAAGEVYLISNSRQRGCARMVSALAGCHHALLKLVAQDDGSGLQRWIRQKVASSQSPSPVPVPSPSPSPSPVPVPSPSPPPSPVPVPSPSCGGRGDECGQGIGAFTCCNGLHCSLFPGYGYFCSSLQSPPPPSPPPSPPPPSPPSPPPPPVSATWTSVASSSDGAKLVAVAFSDYIYTSNDSGYSWTKQTAAGSRKWVSVASSSDGTKIVAAAYDLTDGYVYVSNDSGLTWAPHGSKEFWGAVACDSTCTNVVLTLPGSGKFYHSSDGGVTYTSSNMAGVVGFPAPVAGSSDGTKWVVATDSATYGFIYTSTNNGTSFTKSTNNAEHWGAVASSNDGTKLVAGHGGIGSGKISTSSDSGVTWTSQANSTSTAWSSLACDSNCTKIVAAAYSGYIYTSNDSGVTWTSQANSSTRAWTSVACDSSCINIVAAVANGYIYTSNDSGVTWISRL